MDQTTFIGMFIMAAVVLIGISGQIIKPLLTLNTNIVTLNSTMKELIKNDGKQDETINKHGEKLQDHETRIKILEK